MVSRSENDLQKAVLEGLKDKYGVDDCIVEKSAAIGKPLPLGKIKAGIDRILVEILDEIMRERAR